MKKMNNKGFSLVELIIVIAIMAILAAALAPQLMKYIEKSRVSTDKSTCDSIKSCVNTTLSEEDAYKAVTANATSGSFTFNIKNEAFDSQTTGTNNSTNTDDFYTELEATIGDLPKTKSSDSTQFEIEIKVEDGSVKSVTVDTDGGVMSK